MTPGPTTGPTTSPIEQPPRAGGIVLALDLARVGVMSVPDRPGIASTVVGALASHGIPVQFVVETTDLHNRSHIVFCVEESLLEATLAAVEQVSPVIEAEKVVHETGVALISVYGPHFRERSGCAALAFKTIATAGINIIAISTSVSSISCLVSRTVLNAAVEALAKAFSVPDCAILVYADGLSKPWRAGR
jgi:aspartate kinase